MCVWRSVVYTKLCDVINPATCEIITYNIINARGKNVLKYMVCASSVSIMTLCGEYMKYRRAARRNVKSLETGEADNLTTQIRPFCYRIITENYYAYVIVTEIP